MADLDHADLRNTTQMEGTDLGLFSEAPKRRSGEAEPPSLLLATLLAGGMGEVVSLAR
jgi:hypothetical protein